MCINIKKQALIFYDKIAAISDYYVLFDRDFLNIDEALSAYFYLNNKTNPLKSLTSRALNMWQDSPNPWLERVEA